MPAATRARPTGVTSNRPKGLSLKGTIRSLSRIRGLEPTRVTVPPRMAEKPMGISSLLMGILRFLLMRCTAGKNRAAAPMFCMKLEMPGHGKGDEDDDARLAVARHLQDGPHQPVDHPGLVQARPYDDRPR